MNSSLHVTTLPNLFNSKDVVCDIKYKNMAPPLGLVLEKSTNQNTSINLQEVYCDNCIDEDMFHHIVKNEKRKQYKGKTKKQRKLHLRPSLKRILT